MIRGRFTGTPEGDGWVVPQGSGTPQDLHITRTRLGGALPGDLVEAEVSFRTRRGRLEGTVLSVLARGVRRLVGQVTEDRTLAVWDRQWAREVLLLPDGAVRARPGDLASARIRRYPTPARPVLAEVEAVFGPGDDPRAELRAVLARYRIEDRFPPAALAAAEAAPNRVGPADRAGREDLRDRLILTLDPADARDHDDAIEAAPLPGGGYRIGVHIADVGRYVPEDGALDREAARRSTSIYFPERAVPMLPAPLSSGICSLLPGVDRLARSVVLAVDSRGRVREVSFSRSVIRSAAALSYREAAGMLAGKAAAPGPDPASGSSASARPGSIPAAVRTLGRAAALLAAARRARGGFDLDLPEPDLETDSLGNIVDARYAERTEAHRLVEEFMLLANEAVAARLRTRRAPALHRVHGAPVEDRLARFERLLAGFGERLRPASEAPHPRHCARLLDRIAGRPEALFLRRRLLRAMQRAEYSVRPAGHFALALRDYTHFTSPIRRYPDLLAHRALDRVRAPASARARERLGRLAASCSERERDAEAAERALVRRRLARLLAARLGDVFPARVSGAGRYGLRVELEALPAAGLVPMAVLPGGRLRFRRRDFSLGSRGSGVRYRIGKRLRVQLVRVNPLRGDLEFRPA